MKFTSMCSAALALGLSAFSAEAQQVSIQGTGTQLRGQVISVGDNQFVVRGPNNQNMTFYTNQTTRYFNNNQAAQWNAIRQGTTVNAWYGPAQDNKIYVNTVALLPADAQPAQVQAPAANANVYDGQVVRVVGQDQVVIRTSDGKEIVVYVNPQTTYKLNDQPATITQFQAGVPVQVNYVIDNGRPYARGILGRKR